MKQLLFILIVFCISINAASTVTLHTLYTNDHDTKRFLIDTVKNFDELSKILDDKRDKTDLTIKRLPANYEIHINNNGAITKILYLDVGLFQVVTDSNESTPIFKIEHPKKFNKILFSSVGKKVDSILLAATGYKAPTEEDSKQLRALCDSLREFMPLEEKLSFYEALTILPSTIGEALDSADSVEFANTSPFELFTSTYFAHEMHNDMFKRMKKAQGIIEELNVITLARFISDAIIFVKEREKHTFIRGDKIPLFYREMGILKIDMTNPQIVRYCWLSSAMETTTLNISLTENGTCKGVTAIYNQETYQQLYPKCLPVVGRNKFILLKDNIKGNQKLK